MSEIPLPVGTLVVYHGTLPEPAHGVYLITGHAEDLAGHRYTLTDPQPGGRPLVGVRRQSITTVGEHLAASPLVLPLLLLDVDGVLNPTGPRGPNGYETHRMRPPSWLEQFGDKPVSYIPDLTVRLNPALGTTLLSLGLPIVWCTTWEQDANTHIAPILDLPTDLPVITWPKPPVVLARDEQGTGLCWKTRTVLTWVAGQPFIWVDDDTTKADEHHIEEHHQGFGLLWRTDPHGGLTAASLHDLADYLVHLAESTPKGTP